MQHASLATKVRCTSSVARACCVAFTPSASINGTSTHSSVIIGACSCRRRLRRRSSLATRRPAATSSATSNWRAAARRWHRHANAGRDALRTVKCLHSRRVLAPTSLSRRWVQAKLRRCNDHAVERRSVERGETGQRLQLSNFVVETFFYTCYSRS